ncbi:hypothetical protein KAH94_04740 [bacterium]|nr:hypothetical protein [bacterium]
MKDFIRFGRDEDGYWPIKKSSYNLDLICSLFRTDIRCDQGDFFTRWLDNPMAWGAGGDATEVELSEDDPNVVEIKHTLLEDIPVFRMPKEEYRKMVLQWQALCKIKPKEIIITWDGKCVTVEGRN